MADPILTVRVAANLAELKQAMQEGASGMSVLGDATTRTDGPVNTLRGSLSQFDQVLGAAGINVGKHIRGLSEIADMSGKTVSQIGLLGAGMGVAAAAMAGWKFGTWIADMTGADAAVAGLISRLMGWQTAAEGNTQATRDFLKHLQDQNDTYAVSSERLANAQREVRGLSDATIAAIEIAKKNGATTEQITRHFDISADALKALSERQKLAGQMADGHTAALDKQRAAVVKLDADYDKLMSDVKNANQLAIMEADATNMAAAALAKKNAAASGWIAAQVAITKGITDEAAATAAYLKEQDALTAATDALSQTHTEGGAAAAAATGVAVAGYAAIATQVQITGDGIKEWINLMQYSAQVNAILSTNSLFTTTSQYAQIAALGAPPMASGGSVSAGSPYMVGERGPELFVPERSGTIVPNGGAGNITLAPVIHFHGPVIGSTGEFQRMVNDALLNVFRSSGLPLPARV